ncbi:GNAT family N-acetyltransferase [Limnochorda pilosa]|uniref:N-acetyltransferase domain-containing protein n=1 Tax=Limnochorda pilosa TaxID=1555112 RepID=A0A0K2SHM9_LIMPI|nr:GNAT family N-acetyltransferase [Limnochorda pilosa]BAS26595.1 hypothetical protein LIP_0738 [Limnochorda pilosa]
MRIRPLSGEDVRTTLLPSMVQVYAAAFSQPPYRGVDAGSFAQTLERHAGRPGFLGFQADEDGELAGFAYGYTSRTGGWWHDRVRAALDAKVAAIWLDAPLEFVELAVQPRFQGRGVGGRLHDRLLEAARPSHRRAVLSTLEAETPAMHLYRRRGWQVVAQGVRFGPDDRYRILGRRLHPASMGEAGDFRVRRADPLDVEGIRAVAAGTWAEAYQGLIPKEVQHRLLAAWYAPEGLRAAIERAESPVLVAEEGGAVCGFAQMGMIGPETAELFRLYVLPTHQRVGLGQRLHEAVLQALRNRGHVVRAVEVTVEEGNRKGRTFYEKLGFRLLATSDEPLPGGGRLVTARYRVELP